MSTLVAELLELARLDRTSSLDLTETDLAGIVRDAVADAAAVEPGRPVRAEAPPRLVAVVDEPRIRQVLANLLANVRAHTPVTAPVVVRLGAITGGILIEVADGGPGMPEADAARAFDRFHRAAAPSTGPARDASARDAPASDGPARNAPARDGRPARRRQRPRPVHRGGHRARARRPGQPGVPAGRGHEGPGVAPGPERRLTRGSAVRLAARLASLPTSVPSPRLGHRPAGRAGARTCSRWPAARR